MRDKYQRYQAVLRAMVRYGRVLFTVARCSAASTLHHGRPVARRSARLAFRSAQVMYRQVARRPHDHLVRRWRWYARWHGWSYHKHIHAAILGVYMFTVGAVVLGVYRQTQALSDLTDTWDFTNASQFSMDSGVEVSGSSARLKAQNYAADSNTMALYHFDELGGSTAADSSGNGNNGTVSNAAFGAGNLNNALSLNGTTSRVTVPDSTSLALTGQNSIEAWTKFNSNFTAGSAAQREPIVDKGDYQLYYDNETGKLTYELADKNASGWTLAGGNDTNSGWDTNGKRSVNAYAKIGTALYAGIGVDTGDAEVWKWDGSAWTLVGGGPSSVNNSWDANTYEGVYTLASDGTNLYAGLGISTGDAEVWKFNGSTWTKIGGDSLNSGWTNYAEQVWALDYVGGNLYAGIGNSVNDGEVWKWNGSSWSEVGGDSLNSGWTTNYEMVAALADDGTNLYAGLGSSAGDGEVWKWDGSAWTKIGGDSLNSGWGSTIETVRSLRYAGSTLYAGLGDSTGDASVWAYTGSTWTKIGGDAVNGSWAASTYEQVDAFAYDGTNLYAGLGTGNGDGEVWEYNGTSWTKLGGDGANSGWSTAQGDTVNTLIYSGGTLYAGTYDAAGTGLAYSWDGSSWSEIGGNYVNTSWGFYGVSAVQVMQNVGSYLYAGLGNTAGAATVWRYDGSSWRLIGGQGINNSWPADTYEEVLSMASYGGKLYVGLGTTASASASDGEVWAWDGSSWSKVGGDGVSGSWNQASHYGEVDSLAAYGDYLYAGLGAGSTDGEVWEYDGTTWTKIGGDSLNSGWTNYAENVYAMAIYNGQLIAGLGRSTGDGELWAWNGSTWTKIGGDGVNGSWDGTTYQAVESIIPYNGKLYAGMGNLTGSGTLWAYDGAAWTEVGGDDINSSWTTGTYETVKTLAAYNGDLYAGLGNSTGDGEVWRLHNGAWTKIGGNSLNGGWGSTIEEVESFSAYHGKLYVGLGTTANADGLVWSWGDNAFLQSGTSSFDTGWHHVAATYDGSTMKLYIDGAVDASAPANIALSTDGRALLIGAAYGGRESGKSAGAFSGQIDEVRISNTARSSFTVLPYMTTPQTVTLAAAIRTSGVWHWDGFTTSETDNGGTILYRLSDDDGASWLYWNGSAWVHSGATSDANDAATVNAHMSGFPVTFYGLKWQAILQGDGTQQIALNTVGTLATSDTTAPAGSTGGAITAEKASGGAALASGNWTNGSSPYFAWPAATDADAGIKGYCLYLGTDSTADPATTDGMLGNSPAYAGGLCQFMVTSASADLGTAGYVATPLTTGSSPYYFIVRSIDAAGNLSAGTTTFSFRFDNTPPTNPAFITAPSGFVNSKTVTMSWPVSGTGAPEDGNAGLAGLQYRIGSSGTWYGDGHTGAGDMDDLLANDGSYTTQDPPDFASLVDGVNTVYFRTWDNAGNVTTSYVTAALKINTSNAPSEPQNLGATPPINSTNAFAFSWDAPATFVGDVNNLTYCYTVNVVPSSTSCAYTPAGVTSLGSGAYATQPGANTLYVAAKDESGTINYASYSTINFSADTPAPGIPLNVDIVDVSIKATSNWRLALTWDAPSDTGAGISAYKVLRSTDGAHFTPIGSSSSTTYIDAGLSQQTYNYEVEACDSTNNCGAASTIVHDLPTGKFTSPANLVADPVVSNITTRKATISWSTDRGSSSAVALGTRSGSYGPSEIASSDQVSAHQVDLDNLSAGTTYYFVAKWTDEDGNTGVSQEYSFKTSPAPSFEETKTSTVTLSTATVQFTSDNAAKVAVYYGLTTAFGGVQTLNTAASKSTYDVELSGLNDGTKYFYRLVAYDSEGNAYSGDLYAFSTPPRPRITNLRFQPVAGRPTSTQRVTWTTNVPTTSSINYGVVGSDGTELASAQFMTEHSMTVSDLADDSEYFLIAQSRDHDGNLAVSDRQLFHTALDTRPPKISNIQVESSIRGTGADASGQVVVSWDTDEPATSQVAYAEGSSATNFTSKTAEDSGLSFSHIVIVSDLPTSKVYSVEPVSLDKAGNVATGDPQTAIIGHASDSVLTIVLNTLQGVFGF